MCGQLKPQKIVMQSLKDLYQHYVSKEYNKPLICVTIASRIVDILSKISKEVSSISNKVELLKKFEAFISEWDGIGECHKLESSLRIIDNACDIKVKLFEIFKHKEYAYHPLSTSILSAYGYTCESTFDRSSTPNPSEVVESVVGVKTEETVVQPLPIIHLVASPSMTPVTPIKCEHFNFTNKEVYVIEDSDEDSDDDEPMSQIGQSTMSDVSSPAPSIQSGIMNFTQEQSEAYIRFSSTVNASNALLAQQEVENIAPELPRTPSGKQPSSRKTKKSKKQKNGPVGDIYKHRRAKNKPVPPVVLEGEDLEDLMNASGKVPKLYRTRDAARRNQVPDGLIVGWAEHRPLIRYVNPITNEFEVQECSKAAGALINTEYCKGWERWWYRSVSGKPKQLRCLDHRYQETFAGFTDLE